VPLATQLLGFLCVTPTYSPEEFCLALKAVRESKGITLSAISDATKIPVSVFVALERGDLRRWPKGLFRRSFFRGYAKMIGVPIDETFAEFIRLFPDEEPVEVAPNAEPAAASPADGGNASPVSTLMAVLGEAISNLFGPVRSQGDHDAPDGWVTDARRVGPAPRLRVRIKIPK
jgi:hypothetical protein